MEAKCDEIRDLINRERILSASRTELPDCAYMTPARRVGSMEDYLVHRDQNNLMRIHTNNLDCS